VVAVDEAAVCAGHDAGVVEAQGVAVLGAWEVTGRGGAGRGTSRDGPTQHDWLPASPNIKSAHSSMSRVLHLVSITAPTRWPHPQPHRPAR
jgi:hypothetical protein